MLEGKVSSLKISAKDAISYYTNMNTQFLNTISSLIAMTTNVERSK